MGFFSMLQQLAILSGDVVTDLMIYSIGLFFVFFAFREILSVQKGKKNLKVLGALHSTYPDGRINIEQLGDKETIWLTDNLIYKISANYYVIEIKNGKWLTKTPISQMLPYFDISRYKLVPALLTSIGITGTFLGITLGLSDFSMTGESKALLASAAELIEGMKTAFYTSLAGLSTSAIFMMLMKWSSSVINKHQNQFLKEIAKNYFEISAIFYLKEMSNEGQEDVIAAQLKSAQVMEDLGTSMGSVTQQLSSLSSSFNGEVIANTIAAAMSASIETQLKPSLAAISTELSTLKEIKEQTQKELIELMIGEMKDKLIAPIVAELGKTSEAVLQSNDVTKQLNENVEKVVTSTAVTVETINEFQKETMIKLQGFAESLKEILSSFKSDTEGAMTTIAAEVNNMLTNASSGMDKQRIAFEQSASQAAVAFDGIRVSMDTALDERQSAEQGMFDNVTTRINTLLGEIAQSFEQQSSVITHTGQTAANLMTQAQEEFEKSSQMRLSSEQQTLALMEQRIGSLLDDSQVIFKEQAGYIANTGDTAVSLMKHAQEEFEKSSQTRLSSEQQTFELMEQRIGRLLDHSQAIFKEQTDCISHTGKTAAELMTQAQVEFEKAAENRLNNEAKVFTDMEQRIGKLVNDSQDIFKQQADSITQVGKDASDVMQSAKHELEQGLGDIDSKVQSMSQTVQKELETFREQYQQNLTSYFTQQNNLLEDSLGKQRDGLNGVVDNFRTVFESEYKTRHNLLQELTAQYEKLQASAKTIEQVAKAIGLNEASKMAELQDAAQTMGREIALLKKEYSKASAAFNDVTENLPKAMDDYFSRANSSFEVFFKDFDESASSIHNKLSQAAGYLINSQVQRRQFEADEVNS
jgi:DNA-binding ferritin-like protein (Dps family)